MAAKTATKTAARAEAKTEPERKPAAEPKPRRSRARAKGSQNGGSAPDKRHATKLTPFDLEVHKRAIRKREKANEYGAELERIDEEIKRIVEERRKPVHEQWGRNMTVWLDHAEDFHAEYGLPAPGTPEAQAGVGIQDDGTIVRQA